MKAVIMAGGEGTRLRPLTCTTPKPMIKILGKPVLGYVIDLLIKNGFDEIAVTVRYRAEDIENYIEGLSFDNVSIYCVEEEKVLGTAGSVKFAAKNWCEPFLVISGDCMCDTELSKIMLYHKSIMADVTIACVEVSDPSEYGTLSLTKNGEIESFCEKPDWSHAVSSLANTGIYILNSSVLDMIPEEKFYDFASNLFPDMMKKNKRLFGYHAEGYWCDIGNLESYRKCSGEILDDEVKHQCEYTGVLLPFGSPKGDFSVIPPVYIGKNVSIGRNSVIGPYTVIEDNVTIAENTRVKKSIIDSNTVIGSSCDIIGAITGNHCLIKSNSICLEGSCIGSGSIVESGSTISNNTLVWPEKRIPYRSVIRDNLREGNSDAELFSEEYISGTTFAEITCEKCCKLGSALGSSSCGGKVGIGYDSNNASKTLAMAVLSGLISTGSTISDFGECFESQMGFYISFRKLDSGIYISANPYKSTIRIFGENGLSLYRNQEREIESIYKRGDFRRCCGSECSNVSDMSHISDIYISNLIAGTGSSGSESCASVNSPNSLIQYTAERCFYYFNCIKKPYPNFTVEYSGKAVSASDENRNFISHEKLLYICGEYELIKGNDIFVGYDAPYILDNRAKKYNKKIYRAGKSKMTKYESGAEYCLRNSLWAFDGLALAFKTLSVMNSQKKTLEELAKSIPEFYTVKKTFAANISPFKLASALGIKTGAQSLGLTKGTENGHLTLSRTFGGRLIRIIAESESLEAARELCADAENKIKDDAIDIKS